MTRDTFVSTVRAVNSKVYCLKDLFFFSSKNSMRFISTRHSFPGTRGRRTSVGFISLGHRRDGRDRVRSKPTRVSRHRSFYRIIFRYTFRTCPTVSRPNARRSKAVAVRRACNTLTCGACATRLTRTEVTHVGVRYARARAVAGTRHDRKDLPRATVNGSVIVFASVRFANSHLIFSVPVPRSSAVHRPKIIAVPPARPFFFCVWYRRPRGGGNRVGRPGLT